MKRLCLIATCLCAIAGYAADKKTMSDVEEFMAFIECVAEQNSWMPEVTHDSMQSRYTVLDNRFDAEYVACIYKGSEQDCGERLFIYNRQFHVAERNSYVENGTNFIAYVLQAPRLPKGMPMILHPKNDMLAWKPWCPFGTNKYGGVWHIRPHKTLYLKKSEG